ncbi:alpha/beta fold hydrolase [Frondihabitans australicus]|uniref:Pimeloyl-ACP methyl ester carboxylesterase n=1 Tax=Frondihabitans australicus TaxID=386892 RepID=A0A495IKM7_9MICO|nr:alpha/beta hydrolase [Frondihabitans australicus]RKR75988.1 pimeloyl-ACP methyl ester carboxylesterase [Frondihabitans australicus]
MIGEQRDVTVGGRTLRVHDTGVVGGAQEQPTLLWQTGSPQTGALLAPVVEAAASRGLRVVSYGRPGYGGSTRLPGRAVADAVVDVRAICDALGLGELFAVGASGGGPHSLAAAALLGDRVAGAATLAGIAPYSDAPGFGGDWFAGMQAPGGLRAARRGRGAREEFALTDEFDPSSFIDADYETLRGEWGSLGEDAGRAGAEGDEGLVDDDLAFAGDWGFDVRAITVPVLVVQGGLDRVVPASHGQWLFDACGTELWMRPDDGHISILRTLPMALDWLLAR